MTYIGHIKHHNIQFIIHNNICEWQKHSQLLSICHCTELKDFLQWLYFMGIIVPVNFCAVVILQDSRHTKTSIVFSNMNYSLQLPPDRIFLDEQTTCHYFYIRLSIVHLAVFTFFLLIFYELTNQPKFWVQKEAKKLFPGFWIKLFQAFLLFWHLWDSSHMLCHLQRSQGVKVHYRFLFFLKSETG
jgi:hypothetical protein